MLRNFKEIVILLVLVALTACTLDREKEVDRSKFTFKTGHDTNLFFKNIRQSDYELEENKAAKFNVFRLKHRVVKDDQPVLNLAIINNYLNDQAYLLIEPSATLSEEAVLEVLQNDSLSIALRHFSHADMLEFASQIYEGLQHNASFKIKIDGQWKPILADNKEREAFRITTADYYRLTRIY